MAFVGKDDTKKPKKNIPLTLSCIYAKWLTNHYSGNLIFLSPSNENDNINKIYANLRLIKVASALCVMTEEAES